MYGADLRLGWQVNNLFALYAQPHLSFGSLGTSVAGTPISGGTGTFVGTVLGEVTLIDRIFAGAGVGYGLLNNPRDSHSRRGQAAIPSWDVALTAFAARV